MSVLPDGALVVWKWDVENDSDNERTDEGENEEDVEDEKPSKKKTAVIQKTTAVIQ